MKRFLSAGLFALALSAGVAKAQAFVRFGPPPPPREMVLSRPGPRYVWVPGYYAWKGNRYKWVRGYWAVPPRARTVWVPGYWAPQRGGFAWIGGYWR